MKVRIGIDVGGTFTDAVAINNETYELIGSVKAPTTHTAKEGVAAGIVEVLHKVMEQYSIKPEDVTFIAHGTTQATNALLEGDVARVGVVTLGQGIQGAKSRSDTTIGNIELAPGKFLNSENNYVDTSSQNVDQAIRTALETLKNQGCTSFVAAEAFSVDDPARENRTVELCKEMGLPGTATNDISKLYGLKIRTRTAVVNASIMPKMLEAATMTDASIKSAGIESPLMVMRCDGGVMTVDEVRNRPILTILSGPAAGVAGALMYEKLTDGLFFEVGGTSTDISCVKDGKVMIRYAEVGGHKTYLNSLDVRTVGIGGGSMVEIKNGKAVDMGPRSAHIAGLEYEVYTPAEKIVDPKLVAVRPMETDPEYACIECANGVKVALTMAGAANLAGYVREEDYAFGNVEAARKAWKPLADNMGCSVEEAARKALAFAAAKNGKVARELMKDYGMDPQHTVFVGGGGGAATVVPHLAETMGHKFRIAQNAPVISTIGVALAMVRDMVERSVANPTDADIISVRREAEQKAIQNGAAPGTVEVSVEVDTQKNIIRAIAVGATELRSKDRMKKEMSEDERLGVVAENLGVGKEKLQIEARNGAMMAVQYDRIQKKLFGLIKKVTKPLRLIDEEGVIRLQKNNALVRQTTVGGWQQDLKWILEELTEYNDGGTNLPNVYVVLGKRIIDLSGMQTGEQIISLGNVELAGYEDMEPLILAATRRVDA
ncbi:MULTISPECIES: hydantoinase/oxoprolinase family protein [Suilimivivens]|uniref:Hydantoinase/oxoprolinase family protein n=2 Tax=Suilimivivens TaxID=2981640 RepID=A0ABT2T288_9FIRM|nr:hydantoinase/oxoprolinase family protein [Suilimivivens aceti]MCU6744389.1 hydantoinase/oxoprolinase family protein [Suilimivivens aceti]SCH69612.1 N-methylhydantoinase A/acetone carboxylase%2C beta subunit [uncultured Clostridium sp.]